jgi:hypothetical protein
MDTVEQPETKLPAIAETGFPVSYEEARQAIAKCESPFECRTMADQAAAMAVYARMRDDTDLLNRAVRLQAWAARRWGELDKTLHPDRRQENLKQGARNVVDHISVEQPKNTNFVEEPQSGKRPAPPDGTTEYQRVVSRRLAAIPEAEFTRQVESERPPSLTQLAEQGRVPREGMRNISPWAAIECAEIREACETLERFAAFCARQHPAGICRALNETEAGALSELIDIAGVWLDLMRQQVTTEYHIARKRRIVSGEAA